MQKVMTIWKQKKTKTQQANQLQFSHDSQTGCLSPEWSLKENITWNRKAAKVDSQESNFQSKSVKHAYKNNWTVYHSWKN